MASNAFYGFQYNLVDVDRLVESHRILSGTGQGRRGLGHVTRSAVVMLCAAWELYIEQLLLEGLRFGAQHCNSPNDLPQPVQKELSKLVRDHKHELKPLELAGQGWSQVLDDHATNKINGLNTPKAGPINQLYKQIIGLPDVSACWTIGSNVIDQFVSARGDIAHRGRHSQYVQIWRLENHKNDIYSAAVDTDNCVAEFVRDNFPVPRKPWNAVG